MDSLDQWDHRDPEESVEILDQRDLLENLVLQAPPGLPDPRQLLWTTCLEVLRITMLVLLLQSSLRMKLCPNRTPQICSRLILEFRPR